MASEVRVNQIQNRSGLGTVTFSDSGVSIAGVTTVGILSATGNSVFSGSVTATTFSGDLTGNVTGNATGLSGTPNITVGTVTGNLTGNVNANSLVVSGVSTVAAGSTAAPSISPAGDSDTGIFFPSADTIAFGEGGAEALRINSSGNVGIGTNNPTSKLTVGDVLVGTNHIDIMKMWRTADIQGYKNDYGDGGVISYTWDNGTVRVDGSYGSHNWDIGKVRLPAGTYQLYLQYRPSSTVHAWNVYGTNSNAHTVRLISDAGYGSFSTFLSVSGQLNKDVGYSYLFKSGTYEVSSETTYRINMGTDPYTTGGYKCFVEASYLIKIG